MSAITSVGGEIRIGQPINLELIHMTWRVSIHLVCPSGAAFYKWLSNSIKSGIVLVTDGAADMRDGFVVIQTRLQCVKQCWQRWVHFLITEMTLVRSVNAACSRGPMPDKGMGLRGSQGARIKRGWSASRINLSSNVSPIWCYWKLCSSLYQGA